MPRRIRNKVPLTEESLLTEPLSKLNLGPFTYGSETNRDPECYQDLTRNLEASIRALRDWRRLVISWLLAVLLGVFGNLFASALFGKIEPSGWALALVFLIATFVSAGLFLWVFPYEFRYHFPISFDKQASQAISTVRKSGLQSRRTDIKNFIHIYHLLLIRDCLRTTPRRFTRVTDTGVAFDGFETDVTVELHGRAPWIKRNIEADLEDEIYALCDTFARAATRLKLLDRSASAQQVKSFEAALRRIDFENVAQKTTWNMLEL
jgi:hypothetical protein